MKCCMNEVVPERSPRTYWSLMPQAEASTSGNSYFDELETPTFSSKYEQVSQCDSKA